MKLYNRTRARKSLIDTLAYRALSQIATVLGYVVMVRGMTKEDFGVFNLFYAFIPVFSTIASLGLEQTLRRFQPEYLQEGKPEAAHWLVRFVASTRFLLNISLLGLALLAWYHFAPLFKLGPHRGEFVLFSVLVVLHFQAGILQLSFASRMLHQYSVGSVAVLSAGKLLIYAVLAALGRLTLEHAIVADAAAYAATYLFLRIVDHRQRAAIQAETAGRKGGTRDKTYKPAPEERKRLLRYALYNNFNDAGTLVLNTRTDNFFIAAFIDPLSVAIYAFYTRLNEMVSNLLPVRLFDNIVQPLIFSMPASESGRRLPEYFSFLLNMNFVLQWPVLAYLTCFHAEIVQVIFGGKFIEQSWLLPLVVAFATVNAISVPVTLVAQYEERVGAILLSKIFAVYNVAAMVALLPMLGLYGAALASGSAQAFKNLFIWWHVRHRAVWTNARAAFLSSLCLWGAVVALCYWLKSLGHWPAFAQLIGGAIVCGLAVLVHVRSPAISRTDRAILGSVMSGGEGRWLMRLGLIEKRPPPAT